MVVSVVAHVLQPHLRHLPMIFESNCTLYNLLYSVQQIVLAFYSACALIVHCTIYINHYYICVQKFGQTRLKFAVGRDHREKKYFSMVETECGNTYQNMKLETVFWVSEV